MSPRAGPEQFHYIVAGAGSAGCVVAARLTENPHVRVLLLEAGGPDAAPEVKIPAVFNRLFRSPHDWAFSTEPQEHLDGRRLYWPRGRMLGGSSSMNAMIYIRGHRSDYDAWHDAGNPGWGYDDVLPLFRASERNEQLSDSFHGADGPLNVTALRTINPVSRVFLEACAERGLPANPDFNGATQIGAGLYQVTQRKGRRCSAADAFLRPALHRPNLSVRSHARVTRILFRGMRAEGIAYIRDGAEHTAHAEGEVILCGGAVNSPQLLMLSGVGPAADLREQGIAVVADLPGVGRNLHDHLCAGAVNHCTQPVSLANAKSLGNLLRLRLLNRGPLTSNVAEAGAFVQLDPSAPAPELQLVFAPVFFVEHGFVEIPGHGFSLGVVVLRPESRGWIGLQSADPLAAPRIQPNYLTEPADLEKQIAGVELARSIVSARAFDGYRGEEMLPGPEAGDRQGIIAYIRARAETLYHPVGTCRMGHDDAAVVDSELRVRSVEGLRVADASVMPQIISGNTNAPAILIGEKAAAFLRAAH